MSAAAVHPIGPDQAASRLASPDACERHSPLGDAPLLVVDLRAGCDDADARALWAGLPQLPCPAVALASTRTRATDAFDVVVPDEAALVPLAQAVATAPRAAGTLAQVLRRIPVLDLEGGLTLESLAYASLQAGPEFVAWREANPPRAPAPDAEPAVRTERTGDRLRITLHRPAVRNAFSAAMRDALVDALRVAALDPSLRSVVLDGAGPAFCAGGDLHEFGTRPDPATAHAVRSTRSAARWLARCAGRVRAEVHGACVGAGTELPAFAARVHAREDAFFQLPELAMGLVPGAGGTVSLTRRIGRQRTAWLALSGQRLPAPQALAWGLVDALAPASGG